MGKKTCHVALCYSTSTQLPAYDIAKERIKSLGLEEVPSYSLIFCLTIKVQPFSQGPRLHLIASLMAGLAAALASNPVRTKCLHDGDVIVVFLLVTFVGDGDILGGRC